MNALSPFVLHSLRYSLSLAKSAVLSGNHPFGAVLCLDGEIVAQAQNTVLTDRDVTRHAELNLVSQATRRFSQEQLARSTLVSSTEPCAMCAGAIYWAGIGEVVYGCSSQVLESIARGGWANSIETLYLSAQNAPRVSGPHLESEAEAVHRDFW